jgi:hypothetical protein
MMTAGREEAVAAWRRAEATIYPTVMVNAVLYQQYLGVVRAVIDEMGDVSSEDELFTAWTEHRAIAAEVVRRLAPSLGAVMDVDAVRDAAFCQRHRDITREQGKRLARRRLQEARERRDEWVVLFDDVTPMGSHRLEMHVRTGRALHPSSQVDPEGRIRFELEVVQLDPRTGAWLLDRPPLMPPTRIDTHEEWEARVAHARSVFGKD